jgi:hydrogenase maturation protease
MTKDLILGVGNLLLTDEGLGIHAVRKLFENPALPADVEVVDGGTAGLGLLYYLEDVNRLVIIDAMETGGPPGTMVRLSGDQIPVYMAMKVSPHEITLPDFLAAAKLRDLYPQEVIVWGIQPQSLEVGVELSPIVAEKLDELVENVLGEFSRIKDS